MKKDIGLLLLRLGFGSTMLFAHGLPKLMSFSTMVGRFPDPIGVGPSLGLSLAIFAELFCSAMLMVGFFTRWHAIPLAFTMFVAFFIVHGSHAWEKRELSALYLVVYLTLICTGAGKFSVDSLRKRA